MEEPCRRDVDILVVVLEGGGGRGVREVVFW